MSSQHSGSILQFDLWRDLYARRAVQVRSSAVRDLFAAASRSDVISLSGGMPDLSLLPTGDVAQLTESTLQRVGSLALQYGDTSGREPTKEVVCGLLRDFAIKVYSQDLIITNGAQEALDLLAKTLLNPGDHIITEGPTYLGALQAFSAYEPVVHQIVFDDEGLKTDELEQCLKALKREGITPKFIYVIPTFQNPGGVTMSLARRQRLLELAQEYNILVVEDDPYARLRYSGEPVPALRALNDDVIYLGTVSKTFAPGLRTGWIVAPRPILAKINLIKQGTDLCGSALNQALVETYFTEYDWRGLLDQLIVRYRSRRDAMLDALLEYFPTEVSWTKPDGGFFVWVTLPESINAAQLMHEALAHGVTFVPGDGFFAHNVNNVVSVANTDSADDNNGGRSSFRIAFSYETEDNISTAIERLAEVFSDRLSLTKVFQTAGLV